MTPSPPTQAEPERVPVAAADGVSSEIRLAAAQAAQPDAPVLLWWPAMGVSARYYDDFTRALAAAGISAAAAELRGIGSSSVRASRRVDFGFREMLEQDLPAALRCLRQRYPHNPLFLGGHSLGGQLATLSLARHPELAAGLILVASGAIYYPNFNRQWRQKALALAWMIPAVTRICGYFPGKRLGFAGSEARTVMNNWSRIVRGGQYRIHGTGFDYESAFGRVKCPALGISFDHDSLAPHSSMQALLDRLSSAHISHLRLGDEDTRVPADHFNWVKPPAPLAPIVTRIAEWLETQSTPPDARIGADRGA